MHNFLDRKGIASARNVTRMYLMTEVQETLKCSIFVRKKEEDVGEVFVFVVFEKQHLANWNLVIFFI